MDCEFIGAKMLSQLIGVNRVTFWRWRKAGKVPAGVRVGSVVVWRLADVRHLFAK